MMKAVERRISRESFYFDAAPDPNIMIMFSDPSNKHREPKSDARLPPGLPSVIYISITLISLFERAHFSSWNGLSSSHTDEYDLAHCEIVLNTYHHKS